MPEQTIIRTPLLYNGISQQPPHVRFQNQVEDASNADFNVFQGMSTRQGSLFVATVTGSGGTALLTGGDYRLHKISRDEAEQYLVIYGRGSSGGTILRVLGLKNGTAPSLGLEATVTIDAAAQTYLDSGSPGANDLRLVTIADYTLIVNTKVATGSSTTPTYSVTTTYADWDAMIAAGALTDGNYYKCTADTATQPKGYFKYVAAGTTLTTKYVRVAAPTQPQGRLDKTKLPVKLVRTAASSGVGVPATFTLDPITWVDRLSGDEDTNPLPSIFANAGKISDLAYYRDRLVLASDERINFSQAGDLFNFFLEDAANIIDSDPIDRSLSSDEVTKIEFMVPFRGTLSIFTKAGRQFELTADSTLTPTTCSINQSTNYLTLGVRPEIAEEALYFVARRKSAAGVFEYFYDDTTLSLTAGDITAHVPTLIPLTVRSIAASANDRMIFVLPTNKNYLFPYSWFWSGSKKEQSAWSRFDFASNYVISDIAAIKSNVYMLVEVSGQFVVERFGIGPGETTGNDASDLGSDDTGSGWSADECLCSGEGCSNTRGGYSMSTDCDQGSLPGYFGAPDLLCPCHETVSATCVHSGGGTIEYIEGATSSVYTVAYSGTIVAVKEDGSWTFSGSASVTFALTSGPGITSPPSTILIDGSGQFADVTPGIYPFNRGSDAIYEVTTNTCNLLVARNTTISPNLNGYHQVSTSYTFGAGSCTSAPSPAAAAEYLKTYYSELVDF